MTVGSKERASIPPPDDLEDLVRRHGSWTAVARVIGASKSGVVEAARRAGIKSPELRGGRRNCAICRAPSENRTILRLAMTHYRVTDGKRRRAGSILLCEPCWRWARQQASVHRPRLLQTSSTTAIAS